MANTPNYNLKKVEYTETADIPAHFNGNMDVIDSALKSQADELATKETPGGAQAKADTAEDNAKSYASGLIGTLSNLLTTAKNNIVAAVNEIFGKVEDVEDSLATHLAETATQIALIKDKIGIAPFVKSWEEVQAIVRAGLAEEYFEIGDQFLSMYDGKVIVWTIIGIDHDTPTDTEYSHSLTIQTRDCLDNVQFDAPEPTNPDTNRQQFGNNRYIHSAIRQWLNSDEDTFQWVSQHEYDAPPTDSLEVYAGPGFLKLLDPDLAAVIGAVNKQVARNTATDGGGQDLFSDKVFLLSRVEAGLGTEGTTDGEEVYSYYDGIENAGRIKLLNGSPRNWWLRSPYVSYAHSARNVNTSGVVYNSSALGSLGLAPACCII